VTLVDTSAWIDALRRDGDATVRSSVAQLLEAGEAVLCDMVTLELRNGARGDAERTKLRRLFADLTTIETTPAVWTRAGDTAEECRRRGITIPASDILIYATAREHGAHVLHVERHFDLLASLEEPGDT
jgi:predicted nucleic acid-binding protein